MWVHCSFNFKNWTAHSSIHYKLKTLLSKRISHATRKAEEIRKRKSHCALEKKSTWIYLRWGESIFFILNFSACEFILLQLTQMTFANVNTINDHIY